MRAYTFAEIFNMNDSERQQLRKRLGEASSPVTIWKQETIAEKPNTPDPHEIGKAFEKAGVGYGDGLVAFMRFQKGAYQTYRRKNFREV